MRSGLNTIDANFVKFKEGFLIDDGPGNFSLNIYLDKQGQVWMEPHWVSHHMHAWLCNPNDTNRGQLVRNPYLHNIDKILGGSNEGTFFFSDTQDQVWVIGSSFYGQAGIGKAVTIAYDQDDENNSFEKQKSLAGTVAAIVPGLKSSEIASLVTHQSTFIIKSDGTVLACGRNDGGQLQLGHNKICSEFVPVPYLKNAKKISTKLLKCCFTLENGEDIVYHTYPYEWNDKAAQKKPLSSSQEILFPQPREKRGCDQSNLPSMSLKNT